MAHLLPADPQQDMGQSGHLEAIHLIHVVMHWLAILMAAVLLLWLLGLVLSLLGWLAWSLTWLARRLLHGMRHGLASKPVTAPPVPGSRPEDPAADAVPALMPVQPRRSRARDQK